MDSNFRNLQNLYKNSTGKLLVTLDLQGLHEEYSGFACEGF